MGLVVDFQIEDVLLKDARVAESLASASDARTMRFTPETNAQVPASGCRDCVNHALYTLRIVLLVTLWWASAIGVTVVIKVTVGARDSRDAALFPFPFALTAISNGLCGLLSLLGAAIMQINGASLPALRRREHLKILAIGLLQGVEIGLTNKVLEYISVSSRTMINSMNVLFMMGTALCWRLERLGALRAFAVLCLTGGGALQGLGAKDEGADDKAWNTHVMGVMLQLFSMVIGTQRWALMQFVMQRSDPHSALGQMPKLRLMAHVMPITGMVCGVLAVYSEPDVLDVDCFRPALAVNLLKIAGGVMALSFAELKLVHLTSAVAVQVLGTIHQIPIVLAGVVFFHDETTSLGVYGFGLCLGGALVYVLARRADAQLAAGKEAGGEEEMLVARRFRDLRAPGTAGSRAAARSGAGPAGSDEELSFEELPVMSSANDVA